MFSKISYWVFRKCGWDIEGELPNLTHYIIAVIPHTSNWDFIIGVFTKWSLGLNVNYIGKHQLFRFPYGFIFRWLGGRPVNRTQANNLVEQVSNIYKQEKKFILALAPEGTRTKVQKLKTGFYHIAEEANIPVLQIGFDFKKRRVIVGDLFYPTGDKDTDMKMFLEFYRTIVPKYPEDGIDENTTW